MTKRSNDLEGGSAEAKQLMLDIDDIPEADISSLLDGIALLGRFEEQLADVESSIGSADLT